MAIVLALKTVIKERDAPTVLDRRTTAAKSHQVGTTAAVGTHDDGFGAARECSWDKEVTNKGRQTGNE